MSAVPGGALGPFGWSDRILALFNEVARPGLEPARVVRVERSAVVAVLPDGNERLVRASAPPAVGDWVAVADQSTVEAVLPRWSAVTRADPSGNAVQVLAANVDVVAVTAPADRLKPSRVERELAVAWESGASPVVLLTKADLADHVVLADLERRLVGVDVLPTSAVTGEGLDQLHERLRPARTAVLLGPSGAGKSTLANALLGSDRLATGTVRDTDQRGRHTTSSRQLVVLPRGGMLIDTPGLRSLGLTGNAGVDQAFPDIESLAAGCRFADCRHEVEPGCAVVAAVGAGGLDPARLASYRKLQREVAAEERRTDPLARRAHVGQWKAAFKEASERGRRKAR